MATPKKSAPAVTTNNPPPVAESRLLKATRELEDLRKGQKNLTQVYSAARREFDEVVSRANKAFNATVEVAESVKDKAITAITAQQQENELRIQALLFEIGLLTTGQRQTPADQCEVRAAIDNYFK